MARRRPKISSLMVAVLVVAIFLFLRRSDFNPIWYFLIFPMLILSPFVIWPRRLHRTNRIFLDSIVEAVDPRSPDVPVALSEATSETLDSLAPLGFAIKYAYRLTDAVPNGIPYAVLFENPNGDAAKLILSEVAGKVRATGRLLMYTAEFQDGTEIHTAYVTSPSLYPPRPHPVRTFILPEIQGPAQLYAIHQALVRRHATGKARIDPLRGGLLAYQGRMSRQNQSRQVATGYYSLDETGLTLRPTWKGATLMAWKLLWPVKQIRSGLRRRKASRLIRGLGPELQEMPMAKHDRLR